MQRIVTLAHTIEAIAIDSTTRDGHKKLKPLDHYLKPLKPASRARRGSLDDGFERVARFLDRKIDQDQKGG